MQSKITNSDSAHPKEGTCVSSYESHVNSPEYIDQDSFGCSKSSIYMLESDTFRYLQWPRFKQDGAHPKCLILVVVTDYLRTALLLQKLHSWVCPVWELELIKAPQRVAAKDEAPVCSIYIYTMGKGQSWSIRRVATTYPRHRVWEVAVAAGQNPSSLRWMSMLYAPQPLHTQNKKYSGSEVTFAIPTCAPGQFSMSLPTLLMLVLAL